MYSTININIINSIFQNCSAFSVGAVVYVMYLGTEGYVYHKLHI